MVCFNRCIIGKSILHMNLEISKLKKRIFSCPNNKWELMPGHRRACQKKNKEYKINDTYWPYVYTRKEELEYQVQKEFYMFLEKRMIEAHEVQRSAELSIESWETPAPS